MGSVRYWVSMRPSRARRSRLGVVLFDRPHTCWPNRCGSAYPMSSARMMSMLGRTGAAMLAPRAAAAAAAAPRCDRIAFADNKSVGRPAVGRCWGGSRSHAVSSASATVSPVKDSTASSTQGTKGPFTCPVKATQSVRRATASRQASTPSTHSSAPRRRRTWPACGVREGEEPLAEEDGGDGDSSHLRPRCMSTAVKLGVRLPAELLLREAVRSCAVLPLHEPTTCGGVLSGRGVPSRPSSLRLPAARPRSRAVEEVCGVSQALLWAVASPSAPPARLPHAAPSAGEVTGGRTLLRAGVHASPLPRGGDAPLPPRSTPPSLAAWAWSLAPRHSSSLASAGLAAAGRWLLPGSSAAKADETSVVPLDASSNVAEGAPLAPTLSVQRARAVAVAAAPLACPA
mmetsp:Transcript_11412/g.30809  ORF Transcript_11412/g.30809 Transcript_11412/m.30809 type:complete len:400 (+) Transcript_11412:537-1736(+)